MKRKRRENSEGEFLWLVSLSDLMILLFVFFVALFSITFPKLETSDIALISETITGEKSEPHKKLDEIQANLLKWVVDKKLLNSLSVNKKEDALILEIKEHLLFESGSADLKADAGEVLPLVAAAMQEVPSPYRIGIEGHTDSEPLKKGSLQDNWELSARRAHAVFQALHLSPDQEQRTVLMGYGASRPLAPEKDKAGNNQPLNQAKNRRVTIRIF